MNIIKVFLLILSLTACRVKVEVTKPYHTYFDDLTYQTLVKGTDAYLSGRYLLADTLLSNVISESKDKLSLGMPKKFNPYFYRGHNYIELDKYAEAIKDFEHVASDTTTDTDILIARTEAFKMLAQYDTAIALCNRLLLLRFDSATILSNRGVCYYQKGEIDKACSDLMKSKQLGADTSFLNKFLSNCE